MTTWSSPRTAWHPLLVLLIEDLLPRDRWQTLAEYQLSDGCSRPWSEGVEEGPLGPFELRVVEAEQASQAAGEHLLYALSPALLRNPPQRWYAGPARTKPRPV